MALVVTNAWEADRVDIGSILRELGQNVKLAQAAICLTSPSESVSEVLDRNHHGGGHHDYQDRRLKVLVDEFKLAKPVATKHEDAHPERRPIEIQPGEFLDVHLGDTGQHWNQGAKDRDKTRQQNSPGAIAIKEVVSLL